MLVFQMGIRYSFSIADGDTSVTNEIQNLTSSGNKDSVSISITNGTNTSFSIKDLDSDSTNEFQSLRMSHDTFIPK